MSLSSKEILEKYIQFYQDRGHKLIPNVSVVPKDDPTLLFVNSGMFPLVPYLSGQPHPLGKRLVNVQRCVRFDDLPDIGDATHTLAFHMIGNWSLGDYFKDEQLAWAYEFFIEVLGLDPNKLVATVFKGNENAPRDLVSVEIAKKLFKKYGIEAKENERIWFYDSKANWWQRGEAIGELGGPSSEVFYYLGKGSPEGLDPAEHEDDFVEIGNSVFMEYQKTQAGWQKLPQSNVDFGGGFERIALAVQGKRDIFETDNFYPIIQKLEQITGKSYKQDQATTRLMRIIADHMRSCVFFAMDGVVPSNKDQGYVLRRLLRRMVRVAKKLGVSVDTNFFEQLVPTVVNMFLWLYPDLQEKQTDITQLFSNEETKFEKTLANAGKTVAKILDSVKETTEAALAKTAFNLFQSVGYPQESFLDELEKREIKIDEAKFTQEFDQIFKAHQSLSKAGAEQKFKGGLADHSDDTVRYHTATHLLHMALRKVLGEQVIQRGSNITGERLRFDINYNQQLTAEQINEIENIVNSAVDSAHPVNFVMLPKEQAEKTGAIHAFGEKYGEEVKVYFIGESLDKAVSKEFCGGPHVTNTSEIGHIRIFKQKKIGENLLRLYAQSV